VWVVTGDGDALSIGGNHLIHALPQCPRRPVPDGGSAAGPPAFGGRCRLQLQPLVEPQPSQM
ncbi:hypothetical protein, partial [Streptomyces sp. NPDC048188]|uniref:hypothetical protein n=1 Tax=Streptomyces sp. NPDC048188 TaxID=3155749 RepID=UPI00341E6676